MGIDVQCRLAVYGTLAPGKPNHHQLARLEGSWRPGRVSGRSIDHGWGAAIGYPALELDPAAPPVDVHLFESPDLPGHWDRLDAFEGEGYRRVIASVSTEEGEVDAWIYVAPHGSLPDSPARQ
jgi:gamma-glutamylcyclotransferase (GGCT)/AIG2-like uncharacterized protein YtfP